MKAVDNKMVYRCIIHYYKIYILTFLFIFYYAVSQLMRFRESLIKVTNVANKNSYLNQNYGEQN